MRPSHTVPVVALLVVALAGCVGPGPGPDLGDDGTAPPGAPAAPLTVDLRIDDPRALYRDGAKLTLDVDSRAGPGRVRAGVALPDGVRIVEGNLSFDGTLDGTKRLSAVVQADAAGRVRFRGWAELIGRRTGGGRAAPSDLLAVDGDAGSAETFRPEPRRLDFTVDLTADPDDVREMTGRIVSPVPMPAHVALVLPDAPNGLRLDAGPSAWNGSLEADQPRTFTFRVRPYDGAADPGHYVASLAFYPDPAVSGQVLEDQVYYTLENGTLTASEERPDSWDRTDEDRTWERPGPADGTDDGEGGDADRA